MKVTTGNDPTQKTLVEDEVEVENEILCMIENVCQSINITNRTHKFLMLPEMELKVDDLHNQKTLLSLTEGLIYVT